MLCYVLDFAEVNKTLKSARTKKSCESVRSLALGRYDELSSAQSFANDALKRARRAITALLGKVADGQSNGFIRRTNAFGLVPGRWYTRISKGYGYPKPQAVVDRLLVGAGGYGDARNDESVEKRKTGTRVSHARHAI